jgi:hypothetical protein
MEAETEHKTLRKNIMQQGKSSNTKARAEDTSPVVKTGTHYLSAAVLYCPMLQNFTNMLKKLITVNGTAL